MDRTIAECLQQQDYAIIVQIENDKVLLAFLMEREKFADCPVNLKRKPVC